MMNQVPNFQYLAQQAMQQNPNLKNNQMAMNAFQCLQSGDARRGEELARNYCQTIGVNPEQAVAEIKKHFGFA